MFHHVRFTELDHPFAVFEALRHGLDRARRDDDLAGPFLGSHATNGWPRVHITETDGSVVLRADVPGIAEKDLTITLTPDGLTLAGERATSAPEGYTVQRAERSAAKFSRSWTLPFKVDADKTTATLKDGVLTLTLAKAEEAQPRQISVRREA
jgi:HSP20 family protein